MHYVIHIFPVFFLGDQFFLYFLIIFFYLYFFLSASVLGDPHFITFDGSEYTFNGKGEYVLLHSPKHQLEVQGRTEPMKSENGKMTNESKFLIFFNEKKSKSALVSVPF